MDAREPDEVGKGVHEDDRCRRGTNVHDGCRLDLHGSHLTHGDRQRVPFGTITWASKGGAPWTLLGLCVNFVAAFEYYAVATCGFNVRILERLAKIHA